MTYCSVEKIIFLQDMYKYERLQKRFTLILSWICFELNGSKDFVPHFLQCRCIKAHYYFRLL